jgi:hypothetical protein
LAGVGYAAATIGSAQIKNNSVAGKDIKNRTITAKDINRRTIASLKGKRGDTGATGQAGAPGSALAFARVNPDGSVDASRSTNIAAVNVTHPATGIYCFDGLGFAPKNVIATPETGARTVNVFGLIDDATGCPGIDEDFLIAIRDLASVVKDEAFYAMVN